MRRLSIILLLCLIAIPAIGQTLTTIPTSRLPDGVALDAANETISGDWTFAGSVVFSGTPTIDVPFALQDSLDVDGHITFTANASYRYLQWGTGGIPSIKGRSGDDDIVVTANDFTVTTTAALIDADSAPGNIILDVDNASYVQVGELGTPPLGDAFLQIGTISSVANRAYLEGDLNKEYLHLTTTGIDLKTNDADSPINIETLTTADVNIISGSSITFNSAGDSKFESGNFKVMAGAELDVDNGGFLEVLAGGVLGASPSSTVTFANTPVFENGATFNTTGSLVMGVPLNIADEIDLDDDKVIGWGGAAGNPTISGNNSTGDLAFASNATTFTQTDNFTVDVDDDDGIELKAGTSSARARVTIGEAGSSNIDEVRIDYENLTSNIEFRNSGWVLWDPANRTDQWNFDGQVGIYNPDNNTQIISGNTHSFNFELPGNLPTGTSAISNLLGAPFIMPFDAKVIGILAKAGTFTGSNPCTLDIETSATAGGTSVIDSGISMTSTTLVKTEKTSGHFQLHLGDALYIHMETNNNTTVSNVGVTLVMVKTGKGTW